MSTHLKKYSVCIIGLVFLLSFAGCRKSMDELNINPNAPAFTNPDYLFTYSVTKGMGSYITNVNLHFWNLMDWNMYFASLGGIAEDREYLMNDGKNDYWSELYAQALMNAKEVERLTKDDPYLVNKNAISRIWQAFLFQRLTDLWGDIPYSSALKGMENLNYSPTYDRQEAIYKHLLAELKTTAAMINPSKPGFPANADPIYKGKVNKWIAFANSLRLRMAIRIRYADPQLAQQEISDLQGNPLLSSNADNAIFPHNNEIKNPLYEVIQKGESGGKTYPSKFLIDKLKSSHDPRIKVFAEFTPESQANGVPDYRGVPNLVPAGSDVWHNYKTDASDISKIGNWFYRDESPGMLMSYAEVCFLQAEAALLSWWPGNAQQLYVTGIRANMESYTGSAITPNEITDYMNNVPFVSLENIITQKWISFTYQNGYEAYAEFRRTGYPILRDYYNSPINKDRFPHRLVYPSSEALLNSLNYQKAISEMGPDVAATKVWWNKN